MNKSLQTVLLGAGFGAAFLLGQVLPRGGDGPAGVLDAQGRGPINPPPRPITQPTQPDQPAPIVYHEEGGGSSSNNGFIAVTGSYGVGTSVLYLVDTVNRQLAVYEARGGSSAQRRIVLVGARRIDLDLQLPSYNDRSEYEYDDLKELFEKRGKKARSASTGLDGKPG
ncbi:MAG: hypothetical protein KAI24_21560, partial [Planctomycetes bacterium]|nr:hypothetical protein [Planctomycetota bacterium]